MPYVISWPDNTFLAQFEGTVTAQDIEAVNHAFSGDYRMDDIRYSIWDFSRTSSIDIHEHEIEYAAAFDKGVTVVRKKLKGALIANQAPIKVLLEKYLEFADELSVNWDTRIFDNIQTAKDWLEGRV